MLDVLIMDSRQKGGASAGGFGSRSRATSDTKRVLDPPTGQAMQTP